MTKDVNLDEYNWKEITYLFTKHVLNALLVVFH